MQPDDPADESGSPMRARRARVIGAISLLAVAIASIIYLHPAGPVAAIPVRSGPVSYQLDAVDFVDPSTGWVLTDLDTQQFVVLSTTDAGRHWVRRLVGPSIRHGEYLRFFDRRDGVVMVIGAHPTVFETRDGGASWTTRPVQLGNASVVWASFTDMQDGWLLQFVGAPTLTATSVMRTVDGGVSWTALGEPVGAVAQAFGLTFTDRDHGWLDTVGPSPSAFTTVDGGATWSAVSLPAPEGGWPVPHGSFFVAIRPTLGSGIIATVVNTASISGRSAAGGEVIGYPPLTVRTFDGGSPVTFVYTTLADSSFNAIFHVMDVVHGPGPVMQVPSANQVGMTSIDGGTTWTIFSPPGPGGTIGFSDALDWWWVGPGQLSTSSDAGLTWSRTESDAVGDPLSGSLVVLSSRHAWVSAIVGSGPMLFTTSDGGVHWVAVPLPPMSA